MEEARDLGYRTRLRKLSSGETFGNVPFQRGHVYQILTNPLYAGRIRHKGKVYPGQHAAIIDPEAWDALQKNLSADAPRKRGKGNTATKSLLVGKLFDETGDRLTPSHTNKKGKRLRYYISRRLVTGRRAKHPDAWRLPAVPLEEDIARALRMHFERPAFAVDIIKHATAAELHDLQARHPGPGAKRRSGGLGRTLEQG